ncbi:glycoside hydrolase, partial [Flavobacteriaceae bacterium]|nr:glycoside hydrolase [Flavobacteriaceae bacterium]
MNVGKFFFFVILLLYFSLLASAQKINGISFVASKDSIKSHHVMSVIDVNANYVALMPFGFIRDLSFSTIRFNSKRQWFGERDQGIRQYAKELQYKKVKLMVKPQIWIWKGQFTGHISMDSEEQWRIFEDSYASFILTYAKTAEEIKADIFCIGTELENFVNKRPAYWKDLIQRIKKIFKGKLTYAANWDEFKRFPLWGQLDYIGI